MSEHQDVIDLIEKAKSHDEIRTIVRGASADALDPHVHSLLYSGQILEPPPGSKYGTYGKKVAEAINRHTGANMLDETPRGKLLLDREVEKAITDQSIRLDIQKGMKPGDAEARAPEFLYGPKECPHDDYTPLRNSVWGDASHDYAASLKSDVTFVGIRAPHGRIGAQVELPAALAEGTATTIGGHSTDVLRQLQREGGNVAVVEKVQERFRDAVRQGGIYVDRDGSEVYIPRETATLLGLANADRFTPAAELEARGLHRGTVVGSVEILPATQEAVNPAKPAVVGTGVPDGAGAGHAAIGALPQPNVPLPDTSARPAAAATVGPDQPPQQPVTTQAPPPLSLTVTLPEATIAATGKPASDIYAAPTAAIPPSPTTHDGYRAGVTATPGGPHAAVPADRTVPDTYAVPSDMLPSAPPRGNNDWTPSRDVLNDLHATTNSRSGPNTEAAPAGTAAPAHEPGIGDDAASALRDLGAAIARGDRQWLSSRAADFLATEAGQTWLANGRADLAARANLARANDAAAQATPQATAPEAAPAVPQGMRLGR